MAFTEVGFWQFKKGHSMKRFFTIAMLAAFTGALSAGERDVVKPLIADKLISARLTQQEMTGGEIGIGVKIFRPCRTATAQMSKSVPVLCKPR